MTTTANTEERTHTPITFGGSLESTQWLLLAFSQSFGRWLGPTNDCFAKKIEGGNTQTLGVNFFSKLMHFQVVGTLKLWALPLAPTVSNMSHLVKLSLPNIFFVYYFYKV